MRIVFILILYSSVVLFQNFAASYTSFLSVINQADNYRRSFNKILAIKLFKIKPFETISQLYSDTGYTAGTLEGTVGGQIFKVTWSLKAKFYGQALIL